MPHSKSLSGPKFLLDENVNKRLARFLHIKGYFAIYAPMGVSNGRLAALSKQEELVLVTNDGDFANALRFSKEHIFSVIWLKLPQEKPESLLHAFDRLLKKIGSAGNFEGNTIVLTEEKIEIAPIPGRKT